MLRSGLIIFLLAVSCQAFADDDGTRTIAVNGEGFATIAPDMARLSLTVVERDPSLSVAQRAAAAVTARVLTLLDELGVGQQDIDTTGATVQPNYRWNRETSEQELIGYIAERRIDIEIHDLEVLGKIVEGSVKAGVNRVSPPMLDSTERRKVYREALANAATDARDNAGVLADNLGVKLGAVIRIDAVRNRPRPAPMMRVQQEGIAMATAESAPATYNAGEIRFDAVISAVFALQ